MMLDQLATLIMHKTEQLEGLYYQLIIVIWDPASEQTESFAQLAEKIDAGYCNVNLELSQLMLSLTTRQRSLKITDLLHEIISAFPNDTILLNHMNILFDPSLRQAPLRLLQNLSRSKTIIAVWEGYTQDGCLTYAQQNHPEYKRYPTSELIIINP